MKIQLCYHRNKLHYIIKENYSFKFVMMSHNITVFTFLDQLKAALFLTTRCQLIRYIL